MTRYRVPFSGFAIAALAATAPLGVNAQTAGQATLTYGTSGMYCPYSTITTYSSGAISVNCTVAPAATGTPPVTPPPTPTPTPTPSPTVTGPGNIQWSATSFPAVAKTGTSTPVSATITRINGNTVPNSFTVVVRAGLCSPASQALTMPAGGADTMQINWTASDVTQCTVELQGLYVGGLATSYVSVATAAATPAPTPSPTSTPAPGLACVNTAGQSIPFPTNGVMHTLYPFGTNHYIRDGGKSDPDGVTSNQGSIHIYPLPPNQAAGNFSFTSSTTLTPTILQTEMSISKCPGDFSYWQTSQSMYVGTYPVCETTGIGQSGQISWADHTTYYQCGVTPGEQWYMNWRVVSGCPAGQVCGQTFIWSPY